MDNDAEERSKQSCFATLLKSQPRTDAPPKIRITHLEHGLLGEHIWGTVSLYQKGFERLKL